MSRVWPYARLERKVQTAWRKIKNLNAETKSLPILTDSTLMKIQAMLVIQTQIKTDFSGLGEFLLPAGSQLGAS